MGRVRILQTGRPEKTNAAPSGTDGTALVGWWGSWPLADEPFDARPPLRLIHIVRGNLAAGLQLKEEVHAELDQARIRDCGANRPESAATRGVHVANRKLR